MRTDHEVATAILDEVEARMGISFDEPNRRARYVDARQVAALALRSVTSLSLKDIGDYLGYSDHSSVHQLLRRKIRQDLRDLSVVIGEDATFHAEHKVNNTFARFA